MNSLDTAITAKKTEIALIKQMLDNATADLRKLEKQKAAEAKNGGTNHDRA